MAQGAVPIFLFTPSHCLSLAYLRRAPARRKSGRAGQAGFWSGSATAGVIAWRASSMADTC